MAQGLLDRGWATTRELASAAGVPASFQPAMVFAMMQAKACYEPMSDLPCDDTVVQLTTDTQEEMAYWLHQMPGANGRALWAARPEVILASDASDRRYAAYGIKGLPPTFIFQLDFTAQQRSRVRTHELGSTLRELEAIRRCLQALIRHCPGQISNSRVQWLSDSQSGVANFTSMRGGARELLQEVR